MSKHAVKDWGGFTVLAGLLALLTLGIVLAGCDDTDVAAVQQNVAAGQAAVDQADEALAASDSLIAALDEQIAALDEGSPERVDLEKRRAELARVRSTVAARLEQARTVLNAWSSELAKIPPGADPTLAITGATTTATAPLLPPPWNVVAVLAGTLATGLSTVQWRRSARAARAAGETAEQTQAAAESIVRAIEAAKSGQATDGKAVVDFADAETVKRLKAVMTTDARALVNAVRVTE